MNKHQTYEEALITALQCLEDAEGHATSAVLNIAMAGQYKELGRLYEEGDILEVEPSMFEDTGDANIELILKVVALIREVKASICNLNSLNVKE